MIEEFETTMQLWLKSKTYKDKPLATSIVRNSVADKPIGNSVIIIDFNKPLAQKPKEQRINSSRKNVIGQGTLTFIFKDIDSEGNTIPDAEKDCKQISDLVVDWMFDDPTLDGTVPGEVTPVEHQTGRLQTKRESDNYPPISYINFEYNGLYVRPIIE